MYLMEECPLPAGGELSARNGGAYAPAIEYLRPWLQRLGYKDSSNSVHSDTYPDGVSRVSIVVALTV